jgi:hypothetical protein
MNAAMPQQGEPLQAQVDQALEKLGGLERNLQSITGELDALALQREQHVLLEQTCGSLERLGELGALKLLFGDDVDTSRVAGHLDRAKQRLASFRDQLAEIESRRHAAAEELTAGRQVLAILEDDLDEQREEEEELRNEWVVEREARPDPARVVAMPWVGGAEDDRRLRRMLGSALAAALVFGAVFPFIDIPLPEAAEVIEVPARLVELIRERRPLPPPQQVAEQRSREQQPLEPPPEQEPEQVAAEQPAQAEPTPQQPAGDGIPNEPPGQRARASGILAFRESFAAAANRPAARLGTDARITSGGDSAVGRSERAMVTTMAPGSSGGINIGALSRGLGSGAGDGSGGGAMLAGVTTSRVDGLIGGGGGGGGGAGRPLAGSTGVAGRTDEEIQIVFDRYKAALYRLYNRELRNDPSLRGQMVLKLTIEPSGAVSFLELQSSDMNAPALAEQVLERVRTFDFGAKDVAAITIVYPIDFLPAA